MGKGGRAYKPPLSSADLLQPALTSLKPVSLAADDVSIPSNSAAAHYAKLLQMTEEEQNQQLAPIPLGLFKPPEAFPDGAAPPPDDDQEHCIEKTPILVLVSTYLSYFILILFGHMRDFFGFRFRKEQYKNIRPNKASYNCSLFIHVSLSLSLSLPLSLSLSLSLTLSLPLFFFRFVFVLQIHLLCAKIKTN
jgi:hypothetical protein